MPAESSLQARCVPIYEDVEGWRRSTRECRSWGELPDAARRFIEILEARVGVPVEILSVGADRDRTFRIASRNDRSRTGRAPAA
jgi:adenylosuccinate synthase